MGTGELASGYETPEEVSLGDGTLGMKMVRPQEKEKITQEVWSIQLSGDTSLCK